MKPLIFIITSIFFLNSVFAIDSLNTDLYTHVKKCPTALKNNLPKLVSYLKAPTKSQSQAVEAYFYWITENIKYDIKRLEDDSYLTKKGDPLKSGLGVCQDYAELLKKMCALSNIDCYIIVGYTKERFSNKRGDYIDSDHAWNVVKVDNNYKIVDATWGSGYATNGKFYQELDLKNLFATPEYISLKRLPSDPRWQLREYPISLGSFAKFESVKEMVAKSTVYYNYQDSIRVFEEANSNQQKIISAYSAYCFNQTPPNLLSLGQTYYRVAFAYSEENSTREQLNTSIKYYTKAIYWYNKLKDEEIKKGKKKSCYKGIFHSQYLIKKIKN